MGGESTKVVGGQHFGKIVGGSAKVVGVNKSARGLEKTVSGKTSNMVIFNHLKYLTPSEFFKSLTASIAFE